MVPFWGRCTTHFSRDFSGDWDVYWGVTGISTHGHMILAPMDFVYDSSAVVIPVAPLGIHVPWAGFPVHLNQQHGRAVLGPSGPTLGDLGNGDLLQSPGAHQRGSRGGGRLQRVRKPNGRVPRLGSERKPDASTLRLETCG